MKNNNKKVWILVLLPVLLIALYLLYTQINVYGKPCTCYGLTINVGHERCVGVRTFCSGLAPVIEWK